MIKVGIDLGYPKCCAKGFVFDRPFEKYQLEAANLNGKPTGFIPCRSCATKILNGEIKITDLIKNRKISAPFPMAEGTEEFEKLTEPLSYED